MDDFVEIDSMETPARTHSFLRRRLALLATPIEGGPAVVETDV
ncbi:MAG TPA: hypothetical protein VMG34_08145 [Bacteroidota bacterium]|nr:hypothetical protein [Bacteroidota bacterium]